MSFFFFFIIIIIIFWSGPGFLRYMGLSLVVGGGDSSLIAVCRLLIVAASLVVERGL